MGENTYNVGGSAFWLLISVIAISTLIFMLIWSFHNNSVQGAVVSLIFLVMILSSIVFSRLKIFDLANWGDNTLSFTIGFIVWLSFGGLFGGQSIITLTQNNLFATIASELPLTVEFALNVFLIPIAEEMFWMVGLPFALISIFSILGKKYTFLKNEIFQMIATTLIGAITFAIFHVGKWFIGFIISAMIFRIVLMVMIFGDREFNFIKPLNLVTGFALGAHMANNMNILGLGQSWTIINSNFWPIGFLILLFFAIMFFSGIDRLIEILRGDNKPSKVFVGNNK